MARGRKPEGLTSRFLVQLQEEEHNRLRELAREEGMSVSTFIRRILIFYAFTGRYDEELKPMFSYKFL